MRRGMLRGGGEGGWGGGVGEAKGDSRFSVGGPGLGLSHFSQQVLPQLQSLQSMQLLQSLHASAIHPGTLFVGKQTPCWQTAGR